MLENTVLIREKWFKQGKSFRKVSMEKFITTDLLMKMKSLDEFTIFHKKIISQTKKD